VISHDREFVNYTPDPNLDLRDDGGPEFYRIRPRTAVGDGVEKTIGR